MGESYIHEQNVLHQFEVKKLSRMLESFRDEYFFPTKNVFLLKRKVTSPVCIRNLPLTSVKTGLGSIFCCVEKFWRHFG